MELAAINDGLIAEIADLRARVNHASKLGNDQGKLVVRAVERAKKAEAEVARLEAQVANVKTETAFAASRIFEMRAAEIEAEAVHIRNAIKASDA